MNLPADATALDIVESIPLLAIAIAGLWFAITSRTARGFVWLVQVVVVCLIVYGCIWILTSIARKAGGA